MFGKNPSEVKSQRIDMLMASKTTRVEIFDAEVSSLDENFKINEKVSKVNKPELLFVKNPKYDQLLRKHDHLRGVTMDDGDTKPQLPIHLVLGNGEYARIKTSTKPLIGKEDGEPIAEKTKFCWVTMSPGLEFERNMHDAFEPNFAIRLRSAVQIRRSQVEGLRRVPPKSCLRRFQGTTVSKPIWLLRG